MAVKLRMKRMGRTHRSFFRLCAIEGRNPRDGRVLEELGLYDPNLPGDDEKLQLNEERVKYWQEVGAVPSETVASLLRKRSLLKVKDPTNKRKKNRARKNKAAAAAS
jgi:small subunit ribosomal protein S16